MGLCRCQERANLRYLGAIAAVGVLVLLTKDVIFLFKTVSVINVAKQLRGKMGTITNQPGAKLMRVVQHRNTSSRADQWNKEEEMTSHFDEYYSHTKTFIVPPDPIDEFDKANGPPFIPHVIHQTWDSKRVPKSFQKWIQSWVKVHPGWEFWFWTPDEVRLLLKLHYPEYLEQYNALKLNLYRANAMRFFIMYHFGGVYADLDLEAIKPLDPWTFKVHCIIPEETLAHPYLLNNKDRPNTMITLLASRPGHPFFQLAIDRLPAYPNLTNPQKLLFVDRVFLEYNSTKTAHARNEDSIVLGHPEYFLPTYDSGWKAKFQNMCNKRKLHERSATQLYVCDKLSKSHYINRPLSHSYTDHHWFHVVMRNEKWKAQNTVHIDALIPFNTNITEKIWQDYKEKRKHN